MEYYVGIDELDGGGAFLDAIVNDYGEAVKERIKDILRVYITHDPKPVLCFNKKGDREYLIYASKKTDNINKISGKITGYLLSIDGIDIVQKMSSNYGNNRGMNSGLENNILGEIQVGEIDIGEVLLNVQFSSTNNII